MGSIPDLRLTVKSGMSDFGQWPRELPPAAHGNGWTHAIRSMDRAAGAIRFVLIGIVFAFLVRAVMGPTGELDGAEKP